jgi:hypothetical protein
VPLRGRAQAWQPAGMTRAFLGLFLLSLVGLAAGLMLPGAFDLVLLAGPMGLACLLILAGLWRRRPTPGRQVVIDGSNVLHWRDGQPDLAVVREVIGRLVAQGFVPGVMFDANVGYKIGTRYQDDAEIAHRLGLPAQRVIVVPKGVVADQYILQAAREMQARVVTNDRYRDWAEAHPEVLEPGWLIRGGYRDGKLWLEDMG